MDAADINPIAKFEKLSRNQKLAVAGGAAALGGYLWYRSKSKHAAEAEGEGEAASGTGQSGEGSNAEGNFLDEGIIPAGGEIDPYLGGGFGGSAPANASNGTGAFTPTSSSDGTTPSGGTTIGTQNNIGEGGIGTQNVTDVTGGGAPVTPHPAVAHLHPKHPAHPKKPAAKKAAAKKGTRKTTKRTSQHTQHKRVVAHHAAGSTHRPAAKRHR